MDEFLHEVELLLDWYETNPIGTFESEFSDLVNRYKDLDEVIDIANIIAHNYNCHHHNRKDALIHNMGQYKKRKQGEYY